MDNHSSHKSIALKDVFRKNAQAELRYLPVMSSWFSSVETVWALAKQFVKARLGRLGERAAPVTVDDLKGCINLAFGTEIVA